MSKFYLLLGDKGGMGRTTLARSLVFQFANYTRIMVDINFYNYDFFAFADYFAQNRADSKIIEIDPSTGYKIALRKIDKTLIAIRNEPPYDIVSHPEFHTIVKWVDSSFPKDSISIIDTPYSFRNLFDWQNVEFLSLYLPKITILTMVSPYSFLRPNFYSPPKKFRESLEKAKSKMPTIIYLLVPTLNPLSLSGGIISTLLRTNETACLHKMPHATKEISPEEFMEMLKSIKSYAAQSRTPCQAWKEYFKEKWNNTLPANFFVIPRVYPELLLYTLKVRIHATGIGRAYDQYRKDLSGLYKYIENK